jgi:putative transcriptional regulator
MDLVKKSEQQSRLAGKLLLAMPGLGDPRFHHAVIFMCAHDENGAMGLVINNVLPGLQFQSVLGQMKIFQSQNKTDLSIPVMTGGPVESVRGFLLHSPEFHHKDTIALGDFFAVTGTVDALRAVAEGTGPEHMLFMLGYAGWGTGQLDAEIQDNAWMVADADPAIVFHAAPEEKWSLGMQKLGIDPAMLSAQAGRA